jgi:oligoribonuclease NrnB/cAMP/cGMP phosphodiesterase (DHH superfamily)
MRRVCFYHAGCPDGFGAAWAIWKAWGPEAEYRPRGHDDALRPQDLAGAEVVFADIALPNPALRQLGERAARVVLLDHHVTALERFEAEPELAAQLAARGHLVRFDLAQSGATLAWRHFHPNVPPPALLAYVEDQDLWRWQLADSEAVNAAISSYPRRFEVWDNLAKAPVERLVAEGTPIARAQRIEVERALQNTHAATLGGLRVEAVNALFLRSLIGHELASRRTYGAPVGLVYRLTSRRVDCSLYSIGDFDVAKLAARYGGGGHRNAAGFHVDLADWLERFVA